MPRVNGIKVSSKRKRHAKASTLARKQRRQLKSKQQLDPQAKRAMKRAYRKACEQGTEDKFYKKYGNNRRNPGGQNRHTPNTNVDPEIDDALRLSNQQHISQNVPGKKQDEVSEMHRNV